jgi:acyl-[acyl carrier protein]--UDP-N-acetylglucosamine O-acyltransferase
MTRRGRATLLPIKASYARIYQGKKETEELKKEIEEDLASKRKIKI